jgi:hypothetical protein
MTIDLKGVNVTAGLAIDLILAQYGAAWGCTYIDDVQWWAI